MLAQILIILLIIFSCFNFGYAQTNIDKTMANTQLQPAYIDGKWGYKDANGKIVINPNFERADKFSNEQTAVVKYNGKFGMIDKTGRFIAEPIYSSIDPYYEKFYQVELNGKYGLLWVDGRYKLEPKYDAIEKYYGVARIILNGKYGLIDKSGIFLIEPKLDHIAIYDFAKSNGVARFNVGTKSKCTNEECSGGKYGLINSSGKIVAETTYTYIFPPEDGIFRVNIGEGSCTYMGCLRGKLGIINNEGKILLPPQYDYISNFHKDTAVIMIRDKSCREYEDCKGKWGMINKNGNFIVEMKYDYIGHFNNEVAIVTIGGKSGFINNTGKIIIEPRYERAWDFKNGLAKVKINNQWGYIDQQGNFTEGFAKNYYSGTIGDKLQIYLNLEMDGKDLTGYYLYSRIGEPIKLDGEIETNGNFSISEYTNDTLTGEFHGKFSPKFDRMDGEWTGTDGKKINFKLKKIAEYGEIASTDNSLIVGYPYFYLNNQSMQEKLNSFLKNMMYSQAKEAGESGSQSNTEYDIEYVSDDLVSILFTYEYEGGVHPNRDFFSVNLWLKGDSIMKIGLKDVFQSKSDYMNLLSDICFAELKDEASDLANGSKKDLLDKLQVFTFTPKGITFSFAPYEIGSYAEGSHHCNIPYKKIEKVINTNGPLARFK